MNEKVKKYIKYTSYAIATLSFGAIAYQCGFIVAFGVFGLLWANNISNSTI